MGTCRPLPGLLLATLLAGTACADSPQEGEEPVDVSPASAESAAGPVSSLPLSEALDSAVTVYFSGDLEGARSILLPVRERARQEGDAAAEARALTYLGLLTWRTYEWNDSERYSVEALRLKTEHGLTEDLFSSHNALGLLRWNQNRFPDAATHFEEAIRWSAQSDRPDAAVTARQNLALVQTEWGEFAAAREGFEAMRDSMLAMEDRIEPVRRARGLGAALTNLGMLENRLGNPAAAIPWLREAQRVYREGFPPYEFFALGHLAISYSLLGEHAEAFDVIRSAIDLAREMDDTQELASNLEVLAEHYREAGAYRRALDAYAEARIYNEGLGETVAMGADLRGEAEIHLALGAPEVALERAQEALRLHAEAGATYEEVYDHVVLAAVYSGLGTADEARVSLDAAEMLSDSLRYRSARIAVGLARASEAEGAGRSRDVLALLDPLMDEIGAGGYDEQWRSHHLRARAYRSLGMLDSAATEGWSALRTIERVRRTYTSGLLQASFAGDRRQVYADLISTLVESGKVREALVVSDAERARSLDRVVPSDTVQGRGSTEFLLREIGSVIEAIDLIESGVNAYPYDPEVDPVALDELYQRLEELRSEVEAASEPVALRNPSAGLTARRIDSLQSQLSGDELVLEYFVPPEGPVRIFVLRSDTVTALRADVDGLNIRSRTRVARGLVSARRDDPANPHRVLEGLREALVGPVETAGFLEGIREIVLVPHDAIAYSPAAAWLDRGSGRYLAEDYSLRVIPSLSWLENRSPAIGFGSATVLAPLTAELPATDSEARAVAGRHQDSRALFDSNATEARFRDALRGDGIVHVATHGVMNVHNPLFSRVLFAEGEGQPADDGRLEIHELLDFEARATLVFLSGCETGLGSAGETRFSPGEDYLTLGQAFLRAGVRNVVATLWRVDDHAAAAFAEHFYDALAHESPAEALATAQRRMKSDPAYSSPYYWAGYQLLGPPGQLSAASP